MLGVIGFGQLVTDNEAVPSISFAFVVAAVLFAMFRYAIPAFTAHTNYCTRFQARGGRRGLRIVAPDAEYDALKGISRQPLDDSGLFLDRGDHQSDDRVCGRIAGIPFVRRAEFSNGWQPLPSREQSERPVPASASEPAVPTRIQ